MQEFIKVMKALSDTNCIKMVKMIQRRVMCVGEIQLIEHLPAIRREAICSG